MKTSRYLKIPLVKDFLDTSEKIRDAGEELEEIVKKDFKKYAEAGRKSYHKARDIVLD